MTTSSARPASGCSGSSTARPARSNPQAQGFVHLVKDGLAPRTPRAGNTAMINALRNGGDLLNVFGDFPTLKDPRHADAYSPLWDAQLGLWTPKAVKEGLNTRQIDENVVLNLAATRPDLLTGRQPSHRAARPLRLGRGQHQLRGDRLHRPGPHRQPRPARPQLPIPSTLTTPPRATAGPNRGPPSPSVRMATTQGDGKPALAAMPESLQGPRSRRPLWWRARAPPAVSRSAPGELCTATSGPAPSVRTTRGLAEHAQVPPAAQCRAFGGDQAAPDAMLADIPVPQRELQALGVYQAGGADGDRRGRLPAGLVCLHTDREPLVGVKAAVGAPGVLDDPGPGD